jgi:hypothetical protein
MKVWKWRFGEPVELEVRPVVGFTNRVVHGCENCSRMLILGKDAFRTEASMLASRRREISRAIARAEQVVKGLQSERASIITLEKQARERDKKRV